jgi:hypothetical protein
VEQAAFDVGGPVLAEVFVVVATDEAIGLSGPCGPAPWYIEVAAGDEPMAVVGEVVGRVLGPPTLLHSTSWRRHKGAVTLTFLAVVEAGQVAGMVQEPVGRANLARGGATSAPGAVATGQVLEHALRHLAWLLGDDPVAASTLGDPWRRLLAGYTPEPFRALA